MTHPHNPAGPAQITVRETSSTVVEITGPTESAVVREAADWLDSLDGSVVIEDIRWRGNISEITLPSTTRTRISCIGST